MYMSISMNDIDIKSILMNNCWIYCTIGKHILTNHQSFRNLRIGNYYSDLGLMCGSLNFGRHKKNRDLKVPEKNN